MERNIKDVIDTEYLSYSKYVLTQRAIPSFMDGLKPVARKLLYSMIHEYKGKNVKLAELGGGLAKHNYHHGESSAQGAAVGMAADWSNNAPLFKQDGNFGSRLIPEAAAPRYIYASLSEHYKKYFCDEEVCDPNLDPDNPEPATYLPNIPWVLVNGTSGIAVGFACNFLPHDPADLAKATKAVLEGSMFPDLIPTFPGFRGKVVSEGDGKYVLSGIVSKTKRNTWLVEEVPYGIDREQYFNTLSKLEEAGKIQDFEDHCDDSGFRFIVKLDTASDAQCSADPLTYLKLTKSYTENLTAISPEGKLVIFKDKEELVRAFVEYRLKKVVEKIQYDLDQTVNLRDWLSKKIQFVEAVSKGVWKLRGKTKAQWVSHLMIALHATPEEANKLLQVPAVDMTQDYADALVKKRDDAEKERIRITKLKPAKVFLDRLS